MTHRDFEGWDEYERRLVAATAAGSPDWARMPHSRKVMKAEGRKLYFRGFACQHNHVSPLNEKGECTQCLLTRRVQRA